MASSNPKIDNDNDNGFLKVVDPNPPGREVIPVEDLFIYVKLTARAKNRCGPDGDETEVNFIATKLDSSSEDNISYATTDYTEIGGLSVDQNKQGTLEGFGIKSIDITYNASLVPEVNITFIDLRGASLFDVIDKDNRESPYSVFFRLPYPVFELTIKGYYGQPVTYCLHMLDWKSQFNGSDANFEITAKFVGFQSAFLTDIKLQHVLGVIDGTDEGAEKLKNIPLDENGTTTPKLSDFLNDISKIDIDIASLQSNNKGFDDLKKLNSIKSILGSLRSYVGSPIPMENKNVNNEKDFKKDIDIIDTNIFNSDNFSIGRNILSIRDIIIIKTQDRGYFNNFAKEGNRLYREYKKYVLVNNLKKYELNEFILRLNESSEVDVKSLECGETTCTFKSFSDNFYNTESQIHKIVTEDRDNSIIKTDFRPENITPNNSDDFLIQYESETNFKRDDNVVIYDFSLMRDEIAKLEREVQKEIDDKKESLIKEINDEIGQKLNFNPKIRNVFSVIINNVQAMLETLSDVSTKDIDLKARYRQISSRGYVTDSDTKNKILCPWPEVVKDNGDDSIPTQVWLGSTGVEERYFPEIKFVEDVIDGFVKTSKELKENRKLAAQVKQSNANDNWLPFNILDYSDNPYIDFSGNLPWKEKTNNIANSFYETIITRALTLFSYTNVNDGKFTNSYSFLEGSISVKNIFNKEYPQVISENFNSQQAINYCLNNDIIVESGNDYVLKTKKINGFDVSGEVTDSNNENLYLIVGSKLNPLTSNRNNLDTKVKSTYSTNEKDKLPSLQPKKEEIENGIFYLNANYVYNHNISYLVWSEDVYNDSKFIKEIEYDTSYSLKFNSIDDLGGTDNISVLRDGNDKIISLKESQLWSGNTNEKSRAFLMLNTLPFKRFEEILNDFVINPKNKKEHKVSKVLKLPKVYVAWVGSILWRLNETTDPIKNVGEIENIGAKDEYITKLGGVWKDSNFSNIIEIKNSIPKKTQEHLIEFFDDWFKDDWKTFYSAVSAYKNENDDLPNNKRDEKGTRLLSNISNTTLMGVPTPNAFEKRDFEIKIPKTTLVSYLNNFKSGFDTLLKEKEKEETSGSSGNGVENNSKVKTTNDDKLKLSVYNYFKGLYDKWISGTDDGKIYNACIGSKDNLIDYFKFINRGWGDIGDKASVNLNSVVSLATDTSYELNLYISKILRDSNFLFQIFPSYIDFKTNEGVEAMFKPFTTIEKNKNNTGPSYVCIYAGGQSKSLALNDVRGLKDDGLNFDKEDSIKEFTKTEDKVNETLVAFRVAFGSENQSFFNNVSLNQTEHKPTAEYFRQLSEMVDKRGGTQRVQKGNDLYDLFSVRSYKCSVDGIGNMNIQPLSYFQLDNVPFYKGAYLITSVEHSITPNHMTTSFSGLRQSRFSVPVEENTTTFLNIDFDEVDEIAIKLQAQNFVDAQSDVNNNFQIINPTGEFDITTRLNQTNLNELLTNIGESNINSEFLSNSLTKWLPKFGLTTNSEVCNFLAQCTFESGRFNYSVEIWDNPKPDSDGVATNGSAAQLKYEGKSSLGNTEKGDGLRFKGRGFIRVTGRSNYKNLQNDTTSDGSTGKSGDLFKDITTQYNTKDGYLEIDKLFDKTEEKGIERSVVASLIWWKNSVKNSLSLTEGSVAEAQLVSKKVNPGQGDETINKRTQYLEKILDNYDLKEFYSG